MTCTHCARPMRGNAGLTLDGVHHPLCHPDEGMDCYRLVTVYHHPLHACPCVRGELGEGDLRTEANGYLGTFPSLDEAIAAVRVAVLEQQGLSTGQLLREFLSACDTITDAITPEQSHQAWQDVLRKHNKHNQGEQ